MHGIIASRFPLFVRVINTALLFSDTFIIIFYRPRPFFFFFCAAFFLKGIATSTLVQNLILNRSKVGPT